MEPYVAPGAPHSNSALSAAPAGPRGPTLRQQCAAGSAAPKKTTIVLDSPHDRYISHARDGAGSKVSPHRLTSLLPSRGVRQTGPSAIYVSMGYDELSFSHEGGGANAGQPRHRHDARLQPSQFVEPRLRHPGHPGHLGRVHHNIQNRGSALRFLSKCTRRELLFGPGSGPARHH